jgi:hypothetical protein
VLVCGSRDWTDGEVIYRRLALVLAEGGTVVHGDARGADRIAAGCALGLGLGVDRFPADWRAHGKAAGYIRNLAMLDTQPDLVLAFQRNGSRGTQHTIDEARKRGIPVEVITGGH